MHQMFPAHCQPLLLHITVIEENCDVVVLPAKEISCEHQCHHILVIWLYKFHHDFMDGGQRLNKKASFYVT